MDSGTVLSSAAGSAMPISRKGHGLRAAASSARLLGAPPTQDTHKLVDRSRPPTPFLGFPREGRW